MPNTELYTCDWLVHIVKNDKKKLWQNESLGYLLENQSC